MADAIVVENLGLGFNSGDWLLRRVNWRVPEGTKAVLSGPAGSGKSLLLHALFGFFPERIEGRIEILGSPVDARGQFAARLETGLVFQNPDDAFICATVEEELRFGPENLGLKESDIEIRMAWPVRQLRLEPLLARAPLRLSWSEKKRVALTAALTCAPRLLLADDPFSGLREPDRALVAAILNDLPGTVMVSSPSFPPPRFFGSHLALLGQGTLRAWGPREAFSVPSKKRNPDERNSA
jgi:cobalt/nickel transport system ATP-binding protein